MQRTDLGRSMAQHGQLMLVMWEAKGVATPKWNVRHVGCRSRLLRLHKTKANIGEDQ